MFFKDNPAIISIEYGKDRGMFHTKITKGTKGRTKRKGTGDT
jgi:hypothetical protein